FNMAILYIFYFFFLLQMSQIMSSIFFDLFCTRSCCFLINILKYYIYVTIFFLYSLVLRLVSFILVLCNLFIRNLAKFPFVQYINNLFLRRLFGICYLIQFSVLN